MADGPFIDGLRAAESACWARSAQHIAARKRWAGEPGSEFQCVVAALEAAECAVEIRSLIALHGAHDRTAAASRKDGK